MSVDGKQIPDFGAGILTAHRLTEMGRQINQLTKALNAIMTRIDGPRGAPLSTFTVTAAADGPGLYIGTFNYYGAMFSFSQGENDPLGGQSNGFDCYGLNLVEEAKSPATHWITDASASGDTNVLGLSTFPAWPTAGFERDDGKRLVVFWGLPGYKC